MTVKFLSKLRRREFLKAFSIGLAAPVFYNSAAHSQDYSNHEKSAIATNPTARENQKPGTADWELQNPATKREIEGYASLTSVNLGGEIKLFVNTKEPNYTIEIFRTGWYDGLGGRRMNDPIVRKGIKQHPPREDEASGLIECDWKDPYILQIPDRPSDWTSGIYLAKLTAGRTSKQSYIIFAVRDDDRKSDILFQSSVTTFQAYNNWGYKSLYRWNSHAKQAYKVSFNRPYAMSPNRKAAYGVGAGEFLTNFQPKRRTSSAGWEYNMVRWLEKEGYDVSYATNIDTHFNSRLLLSHKAFLSVGHDEYWSRDMRENIEAARDEGVSLGFFGSNICYWQIRLEPSRITGEVNRTVVAYKEMADLDPLGGFKAEVGAVSSSVEIAAAGQLNYGIGKPERDRIATYNQPPALYSLVTTRWRDRSVGSPEDALIGVMYETFQVNSDIVIDKSAPDWLLDKTDLKHGDKLPGLLGYEVDRIFGNAPKNIVRIAHSPYPYGGGTRYADMTVYTATSGAKVFATGSMQWAWGLDNYNAPELRSPVLNAPAQQITRNVLAKLLSAAKS
ncbi:N,N-dimethylformamidase beta subunit family domain-containing protein [Microcoleus sp. bin38.metabat.b11b12b14.051]|uniref:N,N-dimethylformamidase beta subunit family domain-containing protein n=1 Tax=Microcoleus sp. bin38.metabat.b11b12b14.051 TaxID=2742709 RepID=UPI0025D3A349|nr:N,N-dimethylformamidase beta subunit family domain-containing protein [Microcoleus sp. bin38.metabat.b11b12b14.051]